MTTDCDKLPAAETVWEGKYIKVRKQGSWEYVGRTRGVTAAVILAVHKGEVILVVPADAVFAP